MTQNSSTRLAGTLADAKARCDADLKALEEVRALLAKADERRRLEPDESRKWNRVLENLEKSLDLSRARYEHSQLEVARLEQELAMLASDTIVERAGGAGPLVSDEPDDDTDSWGDTMRRVGALNLEQASELQSRIDAGEIQDKELEAGLTLANQMHAGDAESVEVVQPRRQLVLRRAIDKISKRDFDKMALDEIKVVLACHSLLTSRLEPTSRDQRLKRIMDGAIKILQRKKAELEGK